MNKLTLFACGCCLIAGAALGYFLSTERETAMVAEGPQDNAPLFYRHPMNPEVTSPVPGVDSMGMDYIPVYANDEAENSDDWVKINPVVQHNIGLRTAVAERRALSRTVRAVGRVEFDEESLVTLYPKVEGWITSLHVDTTGQPVDANDILLDIYSPKLVATQQEFLLALNNYQTLQDSPFADVRKGAADLLDSSQARLTLLDVSEAQIQALKQTKTATENVHILAPAAGIVTNIGARPGQFVTPTTELYQIVDLDTVWVYAQIYEYELPWVREGDRVDIQLKSLPGKVISGVVSYIFPYAQATTRTTKVRIVVDNTDLLLRPDTLAEVSIHAQETADSIVVPAEAIVRSGVDNQVYVMPQEGAFEPRTVQLGVESEGYVAVLDGLSAGERVVVSAQFLIDSESKIQEATRKMQDISRAPAPDSEAHDHSAPAHNMTEHDHD